MVNGEEPGLGQGVEAEGEIHSVGLQPFANDNILGNQRSRGIQDVHHPPPLDPLQNEVGLSATRPVD